MQKSHIDHIKTVTNNSLFFQPLLFFTSLFSAISMAALATWFLLKDFNISATSWLPMVTLCLCIFCDSAGLAPVSMVLAGEIFSFKASI